MTNDLKQLANALNGDLWIYEPGRQYIWSGGNWRNGVLVCHITGGPRSKADAIGQFIAAANPRAILTLLEASQEASNALHSAAGLIRQIGDREVSAKIAALKRELGQTD